MGRGEELHPGGLPTRGSASAATGGRHQEGMGRPPETRKAVSTHPTGMLSCLLVGNFVTIRKILIKGKSCQDSEITK